MVSFFFAKITIYIMDKTDKKRRMKLWDFISLLKLKVAKVKILDILYHECISCERELDWLDHLVGQKRRRLYQSN